MQSLKEIEQTSYNLRNFLSSGLTLLTSVERMGSIQSKYHDEWSDIAKQISQGSPLSSCLNDLFPTGLIYAVSAGEASGKLPEIFKRIEQNCQLQQRIQRTIGKIAYPLGMIGAGFAVFVFFMIFIIPTMRDNLNFSGKAQNGNIIFDISTWMEGIYQNNLPVVLICIAGIGIALYAFFSSEENRAMVINILVGLPYIGKALTKLYFGLWAYYVAMLYSAGNLDFNDVIRIPSKLLPSNLTVGMDPFLEDVLQRGMAEAADPALFAEDDPRRHWPIYINHAFMFAHETGVLDEPLERAAPVLLEEGFNDISKAMKVVNFIALIMAAMIIGLAPLAYYYQLAMSLTAAMKF